MKTFYDSEHCLSRAHCKTCRSKKGGRSFRESLMGHFDDLKVRDFECPENVPWNPEEGQLPERYVPESRPIDDTCRHRSADPTGSKTRTCCGGKKKKVDLFDCNKKNKQVMKVECLRCMHRLQPKEEIDGEEVQA
jgi:hypothetical protein